MRHRQITALGLLVVLGVAVMVPAVALTDLGTATSVQNDTADNETESPGLGAQMSSFAQATAADADSGIDRGLWGVQANETTGDNETAELIDERATELESRLAALQNRTERLEQNRENLTEAAYTARASALRSQIANVRASIDQANQTAASRGVDTEQLDRLRNNAANMTGPAVSAIARNITDAPRGPPDGVPGRSGPGENNSGPGQAERGPSAPGSGPGETDNTGNGSAAPGNPGEGDAGPGNETAGDGGAPDGTNGGGSGNDTGGPDNSPNNSNDNKEDAAEDDTDDSPGNGGGSPSGAGR